MSDFCSFCAASQTAEILKPVDDSKLNIDLKLKEAFKVEIDLTKVLNICESCVDKLEVSWQFYKQVKQNIVDLVLLSKDEMIVKVEVEEHLLFNYGEMIDPDEFNNENDFSFDARNADQITDDPTPEKIKTSPVKIVSDKPKRIFLKPEDPEYHGKKLSRGVRGMKEQNSYSMLDIFEEEIEKNFFLFTPEIRENFDDEPKLWSSFIWSCSECDVNFDNVIDLNKHLVKTHRKRHRGTCIQCQKETYNYGAFLNHAIEEHFPDLKFCCIICSEHQTSFLDLYEHQQEKHSAQKVLFCLYCGLHFCYGSMLKDHVICRHNKIEKNRLNFECDFCNWNTVLKDKLRRHMRKHRESSFFCDQCTKSFARSGDLSTHRREIHSGIEVMCNECGKIFSSVARLKMHNKNVHLKLRPHSCTQCDQKFRTPLDVKNHVKFSHEKSKVGSFNCPHCDKNYRYHSGFRYHIRAKHTGEKPYRCPICQQRFIDFANCSKHIKTSHKSEEKPVKD